MLEMVEILHLLAIIFCKIHHTYLYIDTLCDRYNLFMIALPRPKIKNQTYHRVTIVHKQ